MKMDRRFLKEVSERSGQSFEGCFHCLSCSGGCPVVEAMDYNPNQIIRMIQWGMKDRVLESRTIWICLGCFACLAQCPNKVHIPAMMDALREMALEERKAVAEPDIWAFHREFLKQIQRRGRVFEIEFMLRYKLVTRKFFGDLMPGIKMILKGRFSLIPSKVKDFKEIKNIMGGLRTP
jgi:heterodisulfide reductase subunit C